MQDVKTREIYLLYLRWVWLYSRLWTKTVTGIFLHITLRNLSKGYSSKTYRIDLSRDDADQACNRHASLAKRLRLYVAEDKWQYSRRRRKICWAWAGGDMSSALVSFRIYIINRREEAIWLSSIENLRNESRQLYWGARLPAGKIISFVLIRDTYSFPPPSPSFPFKHKSFPLICVGRRHFKLRLGALPQAESFLSIVMASS